MHFYKMVSFVKSHVKERTFYILAYKLFTKLKNYKKSNYKKKKEKNNI